MSLSIKGVIKIKLEIEQGTSKAGKAWKSQSCSLDTGAEYNPDQMEVQLVQVYNVRGGSVSVASGLAIGMLIMYLTSILV